MRARAAYISSFGTGGIIVASALMMLALVSALVAFRAWPGGHPVSGTVSVPLGPSATAATPARAVTRAPSRAARADAAVRTHLASVESFASAGTTGLQKAAPQAVNGGHVFGVVKVPPTSGPGAPPMLNQPPSTGPQTQDSTQYTPPKQQRQYDPSPRGTLLGGTLPEPDVPGGGGDTAGGVVEQLPLPGGVQETVEQITLPGDQLDGTLPGS